MQFLLLVLNPWRVRVDACTLSEGQLWGHRTGCIFLDAYDGKGEVPAHLERMEFLKACKDALRPGGVVVSQQIP